jgi:hypothetical protein
VGIDVFLQWPGQEKEQTADDAFQMHSTTDGHVGYLREAYHGEPYATKILVREAFESENCIADIPAAVMRERLTKPTAAAGRTDGERLAYVLQKCGPLKPDDLENLDEFLAKKNIVQVIGDMPEEDKTHLSVEEAILLRCIMHYRADGPDYAQAVIQSFRDFVDLADRKEKIHGKPCSVFAWY